MYEFFEELLQKHGVTAYKVSKETGVSQSTLSDWKRGISTPKNDKLQKIADYFGVSLMYLLTGKDTLSDQTPTEAPEEAYYLNDDARDMAQFLYDHPEYKVLFDASRKVKREDIEFVKQMLDRFKRE